MPRSVVLGYTPTAKDEAVRDHARDQASKATLGIEPRALCMITQTLYQWTSFGVLYIIVF